MSVHEEQQAAEEAYYHFLLSELADVMRSFGPRQVAYDFNKYYESEFHMRVDPAADYIVVRKNKAA